MGRILRPTPCPFHHNIALGSGTESTSGVCRGFENCAVEGPNPCAACYYVSGLFDVRHHEQLLPGERTGTTWQVIPVRSRGGAAPPGARYIKSPSLPNVRRRVSGQYTPATKWHKVGVNTLIYASCRFRHPLPKDHKTSQLCQSEWIRNIQQWL